ncbi:restriction endonuclease subunit S [Dielma fastidiosa]|uniref:restriction endonuclease subunit S n=1 Tax=Dielma fastidiosa TaxID=1034346 RepID=UPI00356616C8
METMKQSGVRWIGEIPSSWNTKRIKYMANLKGRIGWQGLTSEEYQDEGAYLITGVDFDNGGIDWENCVHVPMRRWEEAKDIQIQNGDLLITKDGTIGKVAIVSDMPGETSLNSGVLRIIPIEGYSRRFLYWVIKSDEFWNWFNFRNAGNSTIIHLYQGDFAEFIYTFPDYDEQEAIASYLDAQCGQLDDIINDLEKQIDISKAYRKSLITEAVTKGLDKTVPMKDSGVDSIGNVPLHWEVKDIKYISQLITKGATPDDISIIKDDLHPIRFLKAENIQNGILWQEPEFFITKSDSINLQRASLQDKDILFVIAGATIGKVAIMRNALRPCNLNQAVCLIRINKDQCPEYFTYALQSDITTVAINLLTVQSAQPNLSMGNIANIKLPVPPEDEQKEIYNYLTTQCAAIDEVINVKIEQLEKMRKHESSLIFEYVTGKKRVKEVQ